MDKKQMHGAISPYVVISYFLGKNAMSILCAKPFTWTEPFSTTIFCQHVSLQESHRGTARYTSGTFYLQFQMKWEENKPRSICTAQPFDLLWESFRWWQKKDTRNKELPFNMYRKGCVSSKRTAILGVPNKQDILNFQSATTNYSFQTKRVSYIFYMNRTTWFHWGKILYHQDNLTAGTGIILKFTGGCGKVSCRNRASRYSFTCIYPWSLSTYGGCGVLIWKKRLGRQRRIMLKIKELTASPYYFDCLTIPHSKE